MSGALRGPIENIEFRCSLTNVGISILFNYYLLWFLVQHQLINLTFSINAGLFFFNGFSHFYRLLDTKILDRKQQISFSFMIVPTILFTPSSQLLQLRLSKVTFQSSHLNDTCLTTTLHWSVVNMWQVLAFWLELSTECQALHQQNPNWWTIK